jgi:hypothetical protein
MGPKGTIMAIKTKPTTPAEPRFGSKEWVIRALHRKFVATAEKPAETISTLADYIHLRKIHAILWKPKTPGTRFVWIDPDDYQQPESQQPTQRLIQ